LYISKYVSFHVVFSFAVSHKGDREQWFM